MNIINLFNLNLKTLTEQDVLDYCQLNSINSEDIIKLYLSSNKLTDISGIKLFKNLKVLYLNNNELTDISVIQYLTELKYLNIDNLSLESNQIKYINKCKNLINLQCEYGFKNLSAVKQLNKNIIIV